MPIEYKKKEPDDIQLPKKLIRLGGPFHYLCSTLAVSIFLLFVVPYGVASEAGDNSEFDRYCSNSGFRRMRFARYCRKLWAKDSNQHCRYFKDKIDYSNAYRSLCVTYTQAMKLVGPELGAIIVESRPKNMKIYLDGVLKGKSPRILSDLKAKRYRVSLKRKGYHDWEKVVRLVRGQTIKLDVIARLIKIRLTLKSNVPNTHFTINGKRGGFGNRSVRLPLGSHVVEAKKQGYFPVSRTVKLSKVKNKTLHIKLKRAFDISNMVAIPTGPFRMGNGNGRKNESPEQTVRLDTYYIDKQEVTVEAFGQCVKAGKCGKPKTGEHFLWHDAKTGKKRSWLFGPVDYSKHPINGVSWQEAMNYCLYLHKRLPTEAEWEKAATWKNGVKHPYPNGKGEIDCDDAVLEKSGFLFGGPGCGKKRPWPVAQKPVEINGTYDMAGNLKEWMAEEYRENYRPSTRQYAVRIHLKKQRVTVKGGSWQDKAEMAAGTFREGIMSDTTATNIGFRCAVAP